jgi:hypothetical protein
MASVHITNCEKRVDSVPHGQSSDRDVRVTVVFTTPEATLAALRAAAEFGESLGAQIALVAVQVVPFSLPLGQPLTPVSFLERRLLTLMSESGLEAADASIATCLCRQPEECLMHLLSPRSLVVLGGKRGWWSREQKLAQRLGLLGREVLSLTTRRDARGGSTSSCRSASHIFWKLERPLEDRSAEAQHS